MSIGLLVPDLILTEDNSSGAFGTNTVFFFWMARDLLEKRQLSDLAAMLPLKLRGKYFDDLACCSVQSASQDVRTYQKNW